jgi:hypothetical protein
LTRSNSADEVSTTTTLVPSHRLTRARPTPSRTSSLIQSQENVNSPRTTSSPGQPPVTVPTTLHHRFIPRIFTSAFNPRRLDNNSIASGVGDSSKRQSGNSHTTSTPAPKLEYVKLPGTKGSLAIKAVETAKKR